MKVVAALYLVALNVNLQNGAGRSDAARYTLALLIWRSSEMCCNNITVASEPERRFHCQIFRTAV